MSAKFPYIFSAVAVSSIYLFNINGGNAFGISVNAYQKIQAGTPPETAIKQALNDVYLNGTNQVSACSKNCDNKAIQVVNGTNDEVMKSGQMSRMDNAANTGEDHKAQRPNKPSLAAPVETKIVTQVVEQSLAQSEESNNKKEVISQTEKPTKLLKVKVNHTPKKVLSDKDYLKLSGSGCIQYSAEKDYTLVATKRCKAFVKTNATAVDKIMTELASLESTHHSVCGKDTLMESGKCRTKTGETYFVVNGTSFAKQQLQYAVAYLDPEQNSKSFFDNGLYTQKEADKYRLSTDTWLKGAGFNAQNQQEKRNKKPQTLAALASWNKQPPSTLEKTFTPKSGTDKAAWDVLKQDSNTVLLSSKDTPSWSVSTKTQQVAAWSEM